MEKNGLKRIHIDSLTNNQLSMQIYLNLQQIILSGQLQSGEKLPINDLSERFGISNTPIRGALDKLWTDGLLEKIPYHGYRVKEFSPQEINDIYETRAALESYAVKLATCRSSKNDINNLYKIQDKGAKYLEEEDYTNYKGYNKELHFFIVKMANNETLKSVYEKISHQIVLLFSQSVQILGIPQVAILEHKQIIDMISQRKVNEVSELMENHIMNGYHDLIKKM